MNILLYGISGTVIDRLARRYGFRVGDSFDAPGGEAGLLLVVHPMTTDVELLACCNMMMTREDEIDAVVVCNAESCDAFNTVRYCSPLGKFFSLSGDADDEGVEDELARLIETLLGMICAHEGV